MCIAIRSNNIVWISGPHLPGLYNDLQIFRKGLIHQLDVGERVEADAIYQAEAPMYAKTGDYPTRQDQKLMRSRVKKRHETINRRIKVFKSLDRVFTHSILKHSQCFRVACIMTQIAFECGQQELFDVREYDDRLSDAQATAIFGV